MSGGRLRSSMDLDRLCACLARLVAALTGSTPAGMGGNFRRIFLPDSELLGLLGDCSGCNEIEFKLRALVNELEI